MKIALGLALSALSLTTLGAAARAQAPADAAPAGSTAEAPLAANGIATSSAVSAVLRQALGAQVGNSNAAALGKFLSTGSTLVEARSETVDGDTQRYVLTDIILQGGDIATGSISLVITASRVPSPFGFGSTTVYDVRTEDERPAAGGDILDASSEQAVEALLAVGKQALASGSSNPAAARNTEALTRFLAKADIFQNATYAADDATRVTTASFEALTVEGGDMIVGSATMTITRRLVPAVFGFGYTPVYEVTTDIRDFINP